MVGVAQSDKTSKSLPCSPTTHTHTLHCKWMQINDLQLEDLLEFVQLVCSIISGTSFSKFSVNESCSWGENIPWSDIVGIIFKCNQSWFYIHMKRCFLDWSTDTSPLSDGENQRNSDPECPNNSSASTSQPSTVTYNTPLLVVNHITLSCWFSGTRLRFHRGPNVEWQEADELGDSDDDSDDETMMPSSSSLKVGYK